MAKASLEVKIQGILGGHPDPLYIPIEQENNLPSGFVETTAAPVNTDPNADIYNNLKPIPVLLDLSGGAWNEFFDINARRYFEPYHSRPSSGAQTTVVQPLLWTLDLNNPLMVGAELVTTEGASQTFDQYIRFRGKLYALDKTNNKVWKSPGVGSAWVDITPASSGTMTQLAVGMESFAGVLYIGTESTKGWYTTNSNPVSGSWSAMLAPRPIASHYLPYGNDLYYISKVSGENYMLLKRVAANTKKQNPQYIGQTYKDVKVALWADTFMCLTKPDGFFVVDPIRKQGAQLPLMPFPNADAENGQALFLHGRDVYFATIDDFWSWSIDSGAIVRRNPTRFTGYAKKPFINGRVLAGYSDGVRIYVVYKVKNNDGSSDNGGAGNIIGDYYLCIGNGEDWHPVLVVSAWGGASDTTDHAAVWYDNNRLWWSMGGKSGYLRTNGEVPIASSSFTYSTDAAPVGIWSGWIDAGRDWLDKWWKELRISMHDRGTKGVVKVSYRLWETPTTTTAIGTLQGTQDNAQLAFPAGAVGISTVVTTKLNLLFELRKADSSENAVAHYVSSAHLFGMLFYTPAFQTTIVGLFDDEGVENKNNGREYNAAQVYDALLAAQQQAEPVKITMPNGDSYYGRLDPGAQGYEILGIDKDTGKPRRFKYALVFRQHA